MLPRIIFHNHMFAEMLNQIKETFMVNMEMRAFKHEPFLFLGLVGGGGGSLFAVLNGKNSP